MRTGSARRSILHADLDAFFVAVERIWDPGLNGRPVVVGGAPQERGVVASASYEARAQGVRSAMSMAEALRLCPDLVRVPGHFERYQQASQAVFAIFSTYTPIVEPVSIDEAYLDLTGTEFLFHRALDAARRLRREVRDRLGLDLTIGAASNRLVSKMASSFAKPRGILEVLPGGEARFLAPLPVSALPGVGPATAQVLQAMGVERLHELAAASAAELESRFGVYGSLLGRRARGEDDSPVCPSWALPEAKSIGHEETFPRDTRDERLLQAKLQELLQHAARRLRSHGLLARKISVKLRDADFANESRDHTLPCATDHDAELLDPALDLLHQMRWRRPPVRLIGVRLGGLLRGFWQGSLFDEPRRRERGLVAALDAIRDRHGGAAVQSGAAVALARVISARDRGFFRPGRQDGRRAR